jgi:hypothetical protein
MGLDILTQWTAVGMLLMPLIGILCLRLHILVITTNSDQLRKDSVKCRQPIFSVVLELLMDCLYGFINLQSKTALMPGVVQVNSFVGGRKNSDLIVRLCRMSEEEFWTYPFFTLGRLLIALLSRECHCFQKLEDGMLTPELCLFGDNAYLNTNYMATPFAGVSGGTKDAYNYYHSQLRIRVECAFGMLTHRWSILRSAIPRRVSI